MSRSILLGAVALCAPTAIYAQAAPQGAPFTLPALPYAAGALEPAIDAQTMTKSKATAGKKVAKGCPQCGSSMVKRWANAANGKTAAFMGCSAYPRCNGRRPLRSRQASP